MTISAQDDDYGYMQDTVVGLQAMTEFVHQAVPAGNDLHLDVRADHSDAHFDVTDSNALVLQSSDVSLCLDVFNIMPAKG